MKTLFIVLMYTILSGMFVSNEPITFADQQYWAKVERADTYFYAIADESSPLFVLPQSYFVKLTGIENNFYLAQYKDIKGYVKKEGVTPMDGTPTTPFFNTTFRTFLPGGTGLYAMPEIDEKYKITTIPYLYDNIIYYGQITGYAIPDKSNAWYYCKYENENWGYVYSSFCDKLSFPPTNTESFTKLENLSFEPAPSASPLSSTAMTFIIIGVSLPCLIVLYLLMKPNMMTKKLPREKEKYKARRKRDYFEFDQSDLN